MAKLPYMQFFPADWLLDTLLLSPAARGIWIDVLSFMWRDEPRTGVMECTVAAWCKRLRCSDANFRTVVEEFELERICDVVKDECKDLVRFTSRRIVRDETLRKNGKLYVRKHRSKNACKTDVRSVKGPCKGDISESEVIYQNQKSESEVIKRKKEKTSSAVAPRGASKSGDVWDAYREAYLARYGVEPVRDKQMNVALCQLVEKLGTEAPHVAAFYLTHNDPFYVRKRHPPNLLVLDATGLRTQWATGVKSTTLEAKNAEVKDNILGQADRVIAMLKQEGAL